MSYFSVGIDEEGQTTLTVGDPTSITLTMGEDAVIGLIKLLGATLPNNTVIINNHNDIEQWRRVNAYLIREPNETK